MSELRRIEVLHGGEFEVFSRTTEKSVVSGWECTACGRSTVLTHPSETSLDRAMDEARADTERHASRCPG